MSKQNGLDTIWEVPDDLWEEIEPLIRQLDPPSQPDAIDRTPARCSTPSSSVCAQDASGTNCPATSETIARSIVHSRGGSPLVYSPASGPPSSPAVKSWAEWTGSGSLPTPQWAKPVWGGCNRSQSDRPREAGNQAQYSRRCRWWPTEHSGGGSERPRSQAVGGDTGVSGG